MDDGRLPQVDNDHDDGDGDGLVDCRWYGCCNNSYTTKDSWCL